MSFDFGSLTLPIRLRNVITALLHSMILTDLSTAVKQLWDEMAKLAIFKDLRLVLRLERVLSISQAARPLKRSLH